MFPGLEIIWRLKAERETEEINGRILNYKLKLNLRLFIPWIPHELKNERNYSVGIEIFKT
jgi:hypothetical protein